MTELDAIHADHPFSGTKAAIMLRKGLDVAHRETGLSIRSLGKKLGYKQATVLSHMASGRVAIPLERAIEIAAALDLDPTELLMAAVLQKAPGAADFLLPSPARGVPSGEFSEELVAIAGQPLDDLPDEHKEVIREAIADRSPRRRWLSLSELPTVMEIRAARPEFADQGLSRLDINGISGFLAEG